MKITKKLITLATGLALTSSSLAQTWNIEYGRTNTLRWSGVVDSTTDTLTINSWDSSSVVGQYYTPPTPLVFDSITGSAGIEASFDVPSNWDGTFNNWGFLSQDAVSDIAWLEGSSASSAHVGWGVTDQRTLSTPSIVYVNDVGVVRNIASGPLSTLNEFSSVVNITPGVVPEPSSTLLIGLGALGILARRKR